MVYEILLADTENGNCEAVNVWTKYYLIIIIFYVKQSYWYMKLALWLEETFFLSICMNRLSYQLVDCLVWKKKSVGS